MDTSNVQIDHYEPVPLSLQCRQVVLNLIYVKL